MILDTPSAYYRKPISPLLLVGMWVLGETSTIRFIPVVFSYLSLRRAVYSYFYHHFTVYNIHLEVA